jgi:hypothetical protein
MYRCEREEQRPIVFENRVLRGALGSKTNDVAGGWELLKMRSILIYTADQMLLGSRQAG